MSEFSPKNKKQGSEKKTKTDNIKDGLEKKNNIKDGYKQIERALRQQMRIIAIDF